MSAAEQSPEIGQPHRIDMEAEWDEFTRMKALVDEGDAADFLAVIYAWRDEAVTDVLRTRPAERLLRLRPEEQA